MTGIIVGKQYVWYASWGVSGPWTVDRIQGSLITLRSGDHTVREHIAISELVELKP